MRLSGRFALGGLLLCGCFSARPTDVVDAPPAERPVSYASEKERMIRLMEERMNALVGTTQDRLAAIRDGLKEALELLLPPTRLLAVERTFRGYAAADQERFDAEIERLVEQAIAETEELVGRAKRPGRDEIVGSVTREAFRIAAEIGGDGEGAGYGFVSGVQEVDEMARVTIELLQGYADVEGLRDMGEIRRGEMLELNQSFRHDVTAEDLAGHADQALASLLPAPEGRSGRVGRLLLFQSDVLDALRMDHQENVVVVVAFQNDRIPVDHGLGLIQARRHRIVRGGMVVLDSPWTLDPQTPGRDGVPAMREDLVERRFLASEAFVPAINVDHADFERLRDFTVIYDYSSGVLDRRTGEVLGAISWQLQWIVSMEGGAAMLDSAPPSFDAEARVLTSLLRRGDDALSRAGERQPSPSDRFGEYRQAGFEALAPPSRPLPGGGEAKIVEILGNDHYRIPAHGRRFLLANRLPLLADDVRFFHYLEGGRDRYVLRLTQVEEGSPVADLGFRRGDEILSVNGQDVETFTDLWQAIAERPRESVYEVRLVRRGAQRRLVYEVLGVPADHVPEETFDENPTDEMMQRLESLFRQGAE